MIEKIGVNPLSDGKFEFNVWAPFLESVSLNVISPKKIILPMNKKERGYWSVVADGVEPGALYFYKLNNEIDRPDPASMYQPEGPHGPSQIICHDAFKWEDNGWRGVPLNEMIIYELHVGTFTPEGTFTAIIERLDYLKSLGVNTIEIMPVAQFPGTRNWGYDGTYIFAVQNSYGGTDGLKSLVNACHKKGLAVVLDVVYNHLGPEGNYLAEFGPYFTERHTTPWGKAINFDDAYSSEVRNFFIKNALYWFQFYHIDSLRLDAVHGICDMGAKHFLEELVENVGALSADAGREFYLIAESDLNDIRVIQKKECGGYGIDAQWSDDFHHSVHTLLTGERSGYYEDFGSVEHFLSALKETFVYSWKYSPHRKRNHGSNAKGIPPHQFVVCIQNHDQIGNRMLGERLSRLISYEALKLAAAILITSPYIPLLFMGEEFAEDNPFLYFISHSDASLVNAVREGRKKEFNAFGWKKEPPDPQGKDTFLNTKLQWEKLSLEKHKVMFAFYQQLIAFRKRIPALNNLSKENLAVWAEDGGKLIFMKRWHKESMVFSVMNFDDKAYPFVACSIEKAMKKALDTSDARWLGKGTQAPEVIENGRKVTINPFSFVMYTTEVRL